MTDIQDLIGKKIKSITGLEQYSDEIRIYFDDKKETFLRMFHEQDCCEAVSVEDVCGDASDFIGEILTKFEERTEYGNQEDDEDNYGESSTYTFYELASPKGTMTIRWYGTSNGYYSESVDIEIDSLEDKVVRKLSGKDY